MAGRCVAAVYFGGIPPSRSEDCTGHRTRGKSFSLPLLLQASPQAAADQLGKP